MRDALSKALDFVLLLTAGSAIAFGLVCFAVGALVIGLLSLVSAMLGQGRHR